MWIIIFANLTQLAEYPPGYTLTNQQASHHCYKNTHQRSGQHILRLGRFFVTETNNWLCSNQQSQSIIPLQADKYQYQPTFYRTDQCPCVKGAVIIRRHIHTIVLQHQLDKDICRLPAHQDRYRSGNILKPNLLLLNQNILSDPNPRFPPNSVKRRDASYLE